MKKTLFSIALTGLLLGIYSHSLLAARGDLKVYQGDLVSPRIELADMQGRRHSLEDYRGQIVLVQFWATYCAPCRKEMPTMNRLIKKMQGKPFRILTVNMAESRQQVTQFLEEVPVDFPVLLDSDGSTLARWKVFAAPANFVLDKNGEIIFTLYGAIDWDADEMVQKLSALSES